MAPERNKNNNGKRLGTQQSVDQAIKSICEIMRGVSAPGRCSMCPK